GHDVRDDDGNADEEKVGVMHHEGVARGTVLPRPSRMCDQHSERIHGRGNETGDQRLLRIVRHDRREHENDGADPGDFRHYWHAWWYGVPVRVQADSQGGEYLIGEPEIEDEPRVAGRGVAAAVSEQSERCENARDRNGISRLGSLPRRIRGEEVVV